MEEPALKTLYLECTSGISGDMTVAALLDLGADETALREGLRSLHVNGYEITIARTQKSGIDACDFDVVLQAHDEQETHGHRNLTEILAIIEGSGITQNAKRLAKSIFTIIAEAEAKVHGLPIGEVHFHEVGAVDSIVDIVAAAICIDALQIEQVLCSPLSEGTGTIVCQHGTIPVPAPATLEIARKHKIPLVMTENNGEMVTPTGAGIVAALVNRFERPSQMRVLAVGYGAGKREYSTANVLRAFLIEEQDKQQDQQHAVLLLECNLDDMTGEHLAYACEKLLEADALDVWCTPIIMKKGRPAQVLSVLCGADQEQEMTKLLFRHTSTIGVRISGCRRHMMEREQRKIPTKYGSLTVKDTRWGNVKKTTVEYESARIISETCKIPIDEVYRSAYNE